MFLLEFSQLQQHGYQLFVDNRFRRADKLYLKKYFKTSSYQSKTKTKIDALILQIDRTFNLQELAVLCFDLGIDFEHLSSPNKLGKIKNLLKILSDKKQIEKIFDYLETKRPHVDWGKNKFVIDRIYYEIANNQIAPIEEIRFKLLSSQIIIVIVIATLTLTGVLYPTISNWLNIQTRQANWTQPDVDDFTRIAILQNLEGHPMISALTRSTFDQTEILWFTTFINGESSLYQLVNPDTEEESIKKIFQTKGRVLEIEVDCKLNVWMAFEERGVLVFDPSEQNSDFWLNKNSFKDFLPYNTIYALESACDAAGESVQIWFGRKSVHSIRYSTDYPNISQLEDVVIFDNPPEIGSVRVNDLVYVPNTSELWILGSNSAGGVMWSLSLDNKRPVEKVKLKSLSLRSGYLTEDAFLVAGGDKYIVLEGNELRLMDIEGEEVLARGMRVIYADGTIWVGDICPEILDSDDLVTTEFQCNPLGVFNGEHYFPIEILANGIFGFELSKAGTLWMATDNGFYRYTPVNSDGP